MLFKGRNEILNVSPTDIDGYIQLDKNNIFIFFELKHHGEPSCGQKTALTAMVDTLRRGRGNAVLIIAKHNTPANQMIMARDAVVTRTYYDGKWSEYHSGKYKLKETINNYISRIGVRAEIERLEDEWL